MNDASRHCHCVAMQRVHDKSIREDGDFRNQRTDGRKVVDVRDMCARGDAYCQHASTNGSRRVSERAAVPKLTSRPVRSSPSRTERRRVSPPRCSPNMANHVKRARAIPAPSISTGPSTVGSQPTTARRNRARLQLCHPRPARRPIQAGR